jgi:hypothetical protein
MGNSTALWEDTVVETAASALALLLLFVEFVELVALGISGVGWVMLETAAVAFVAVPI